MNRHTNSAFLLVLTLTASSVSHAALAANSDEQVAARLDALEKENAALRARLNRLEASKVAKIKHHPAAAEPDPALAAIPRSRNADALAADAGHAVGIRTSISPPRFEVSGSLLFLQPGAGNLEYGTLVTPFPIATPNWSNQSLHRNSVLPSVSGFAICPTSPTISN